MLRLIFVFFHFGVLGTIGSIVGIGSGLNSLFGGGNQNTQQSQSGPNPQSMAWLQQALGGAGSVGQTLNPYEWQAFLSQAGIDPSQLIGAGQQAGQQYGGLSNLAQQYGGQLGAQAGQQFGAGQAIYNMGMDPQNQLHDFLQQQVVDNSRAGTSARGIGMSPYAAGLENQATTNFNMDWQNQQLGRGATGIQSMNAANQLGASDLTGSLGFGAQAPQFTLQGGMAPIQAQQYGYNIPNQAANQYQQQYSNAFVQPYTQAAGMGGTYSNTQNPFSSQTAGLERILGGMQGLQGGGNATPQTSQYGYGTGQADYSGGYY